MFQHSSDNILNACGVTKDDLTSYLIPYMMKGCKTLEDIHNTLREQILGGIKLPYKELLILGLILPTVKGEGDMCYLIRAHMEFGGFQTLSELFESLDEIDISAMLLKTGGHNVKYFNGLCS